VEYSSRSSIFVPYSASLTKLYPDAIQIETAPPGVVRVGQKGHMITSACALLTNKLSDFFFTLTEDEQKCIASIEKVVQRVKKKDKNGQPDSY
jgi:hypothetical protein